jgi:xanthine dehydrogenase YagR molybdenum-binding subunit
MPKTETAAMYAFAAHFAEVRVRPETGTVRLTKMTSRVDIGQVLNPMQARSQVLGGLVFGICMALKTRWSKSDEALRPAW